MLRLVVALLPCGDSEVGGACCPVASCLMLPSASTFHFPRLAFLTYLVSGPFSLPLVSANGYRFRRASAKWVSSISSSVFYSSSYPRFAHRVSGIGYSEGSVLKCGVVVMAFLLVVELGVCACVCFMCVAKVLILTGAMF